MLWLRVVAGLAVVAAALWIIVGEQLSGASADATVNARLVTVRAPVAGEVTLPARDFGTRLAAGEVLATMTDPLVDGVRLDDLLMERAFSEAIVAREDAVRIQLEAAITAQEERLARYRAERIAEIEARLAFAQERLQVLEAGGAPEGAEADVSLALDENGGRQPLEPRLPDLWVNYARERVETLGIALRAAREGVFLGDGYNDAPYAEQRLSELRRELAAALAERAEAEARLAAVNAREAAERRRVNRFGGAELTSPVDGLFWEELASNGQVVQRGDPVARLLDCRSTLVTLSVTEAVYNRLAIGDEAVFRPRSTRSAYQGTVLRLAGAGAATLYRNLAVAPSQKHLERYDVAVLVPGLRDDPALGCAVGRTGRVFFDARPLDRVRDLFR